MLKSLKSFKNSFHAAAQSEESDFSGIEKAEGESRPLACSGRDVELHSPFFIHAAYVALIPMGDQTVESWQAPSMGMPRKLKADIASL